MNLAHANQIAKAVLYEGYMLYPYRPSSVKNRQRFNFGVAYPQSYCEAMDNGESWRMRTECLCRGEADTSVDLRLRFLHLETRTPSQTKKVDFSPPWQEAAEREVCHKFTLKDLTHRKVTTRFDFPASDSSYDENGDVPYRVLTHQEAVEGYLDLTVTEVLDDVFKIAIEVRNQTPLAASDISRDQALMRSLISTHFVVGIEHGKFISLLEPPEELQSLAAQCENIGVWPVLVGEPGQHDTMIASPIILYDYPQIAPESTGDLFDGTEIDEILSLRIMTLTDEEKEEIRNSDERARQILERTENMPAEQFMKLHGSVRSLRPLAPSEKENA